MKPHSNEKGGRGNQELHIHGDKDRTVGNKSIAFLFLCKNIPYVTDILEENDVEVI